MFYKSANENKKKNKIKLWEIEKIIKQIISKY